MPLAQQSNYRHIATITPHDTNLLAVPIRAVICGTAGVLQLDFADGSTGAMPVAVGIEYGIEPIRIKATGHTAGVVVALS
jgi:hypothetical protein